MEKIMPVLFVGHGSPMNTIEDNEFTRSWNNISKKIPKPKAILAISAHYERADTSVTSNERLKTIHDFYGFQYFTNWIRKSSSFIPISKYFSVKCLKS